MFLRFYPMGLFMVDFMGITYVFESLHDPCFSFHNKHCNILQKPLSKTETTFKFLSYS